MVLDPCLRLANVWLDADPPQARQVAVLAKRALTAPKSSTYYLIVPSWRTDYGPRMLVPVPVEVYKRAEAGQRLSLTSRHGGLGEEHLDGPPALIPQQIP